MSECECVCVCVCVCDFFFFFFDRRDRNKDLTSRILFTCFDIEFLINLLSFFTNNTIGRTRQRQMSSFYRVARATPFYISGTRGCCWILTSRRPCRVTSGRCVGRPCSSRPRKKMKETAESRLTSCDT